ncbi:hypothetical protein BS17DRAFT_786238 [Gyrodon lividus]|nr:hypothetical protein BS17DRAFT_786238 [Gyrodon lividus]
MSRPTQRLLPFLRFTVRVKVATRTTLRAAFSKRMVSSESHAGHSSPGSDTPWILGSALVFGPAFLYLVSPSARKSSHGHAEHEHKGHHDEYAQHAESQPAQETPSESMTDDEGTEVSGEEIKESIGKSFEVDSPKDAQEHEEAVANAETTFAFSEQSLSTDPPSQSESSTDDKTDSASEGAAPAHEPESALSEEAKSDASTSEEQQSKTVDEKIESAGESQA